MKRYLIILISMLFLFASCEKKDETSSTNKGISSSNNTEEPYLRITNGTRDQQINYDGGVYNVMIESNTDWICYCTSQGEINLRTDKTRGHGDDIIRVSYDNTRNATYRVTYICSFIIKWEDQWGITQQETILFIRYPNPYL